MPKETKEYEGAAGADTKSKSNPLKEYESKEPMTPAKIAEQEPTAVKRDASEQSIVDRGQEGTDPERAKEIARSKGMAKGTAGAWKIGDEYEQGAAGTST